MDSSQEGYQPPPNFQEDTKVPLVDISLTDSTELWLIQWPINQLQPDDFTGKSLSLKLQRDGHLGSLETSSGKSYDMVSFAAQEPDATVFLASASKSKVVGKISRRVSLVRYPEPDEFEKPSSTYPSLSNQRSSASLRSNMSHSFSTPMQSWKQRNSQATSGMTHSMATLSQGSRQRSEEKSKHSKKRRMDSTPSSVEPMRSGDRSTLDSGGEGRSLVSSLGFSEHNRGKSKRKKQNIAE